MCWNANSRETLSESQQLLHERPIEPHLSAHLIVYLSKASAAAMISSSKPRHSSTACDVVGSKVASAYPATRGGACRVMV
jgi:hypothetical protein